jgi:hypothetical protein
MTMGAKTRMLAGVWRAVPATLNHTGTSAIWAKVKFDRQIVAIAKVIGATEIYSDDGHVSRLAKQANIKCIGVADLPLPEEDRKFKLDLEGHADAVVPKPQDNDEEDKGPGSQPPAG